MSVELIVEVLKHAPADLNPTERLTLVAIAESCRTDTRMTYYRDGWDADELARRVGVTAESLTKVFRSLAKKGLEVRVPHAVKDGKPVFAFKGKQTTFKLPPLAPQRVDESPGFNEEDRGKGWTSVRESLDESPGNGAQSLDESPPLLLKVLPSKNTSSLSRGDDEPLPPAAIPAQRAEREIEPTSSSKPKDQNPVDAALIEAGCPEGRASEIQNHLTDTLGLRSPAGFILTAAQNGTLPDRVAEGLRALDRSKSDGKPPWCGHCDERTRQRTTEWMENISVSRCPDCHPLAVRQDTQDRSGAHEQPFKRSAPGFDKHGNGFRPGSSYHWLSDSRAPGRDYSEPL